MTVQSKLFFKKFFKKSTAPDPSVTEPGVLRAWLWLRGHPIRLGLGRACQGVQVQLAAGLGHKLRCRGEDRAAKRAGM